MRSLALKLLLLLILRALAVTSALGVVAVRLPGGAIEAEKESPTGESIQIQRMRARLVDVHVRGEQRCHARENLVVGERRHDERRGRRVDWLDTDGKTGGRVGLVARLDSLGVEESRSCTENEKHELNKNSFAMHSIDPKAQVKCVF
ncbi:hypothetical protein B0H11DRAFT_2006594 [Mycena galericulata]|nr:hypothetical protein B0H11DRAFT_2006594 [Mycena galericulata]